MGCYSFKKLKKRKIFGKSAYKKGKALSGTTVYQCIQMARENGYEIIGIQRKRQTIFCRKGNERQSKLNTPIPTLNPWKCKPNIRSIFVYRQNPGINYSILAMCYTFIRVQWSHAW